MGDRDLETDLALEAACLDFGPGLDVLGGSGVGSFSTTRDFGPALPRVALEAGAGGGVGSRRALLDFGPGLAEAGTDFVANTGGETSDFLDAGPGRLEGTTECLKD